MEDDEIEPTDYESRVMSTFRALLRRTVSLLRQEEELLEQQMVNAAMQESMDTYHDSLFREDPTRTINIEPSPKLDDEPQTCHVCLEQMVKGDLVVALPCQHSFHPPCIQQLVVHQHLACPLCRKTIPFS